MGAVEYGWPLGGDGWGHGINYSLSGEYEFNESFSTLIRTDYIILKYTQPLYSVPGDNARNKIICFTGEIKPKIWIFNILLGFGVSYQNVDEIKYDYIDKPAQVKRTHYIVEGDHNLRTHFLLGIGSNIKILQNLDVLLQMRLLLRKVYVPSIVEVGLRYKI
jgi:hypothetical protein